MLRWTWNSLFAERWNLLASLAAIGGAFSLVLFFEAVFAGESKQIIAYIEKTDSDVWVMQRGVSNMHMATSFISDWKGERIKDLGPRDRRLTGWAMVSIRRKDAP
jgi:hypothetical protein